jgi:hypothetical protein
MIRGSLAGVRRDGFLPDRFENSPVDRVKPTAWDYILCFDVEGEPKIPRKQYTTSKSHNL